MSSIQDEIKRLKQLQKEIISNLPKVAETIAKNDLVAMISHRVINEQTDSDGSSFSSYSKKPTLTNQTAMTKAAYSKIGGSKKKRRERKWVTINGRKLMELEGGYQEFRELHGHTNKKKNFSFTNEMWRKFGIKRVEESAVGVIVYIGGTNEASQNKIDWNSEREGKSIIEASDEERKFVEEKMQDWIDKTANKIIKTS